MLGGKSELLASLDDLVVNMRVSSVKSKKEVIATPPFPMYKLRLNSDL